MEHRPRDADHAHPRLPRSNGHPASGQSTQRVPRAGEKPWVCCLLTWPVQLPPPELELGEAAWVPGGVLSARGTCFKAMEAGGVPTPPTTDPVGALRGLGAPR